MNLTLDQLSFGAAVISAAQVQNTDQLRHKAAWLQRLADEVEAERKRLNPPTEQPPENR